MKIKQLFNALNKEEKSLSLLVQPSWLSGVLAVVVSLAVVVGTVGMANYSGSKLQLIKEEQAAKTHVIDYDALEEGFTANNLISSLPLFIFWAGVGLVAYTFTMSVARAFRGAVDFEHQLDYVHSDRDQMLKAAAYRLAFRLGVLVGWFLYIQFTVQIILPYVTALAVAAAGSYGWLQNGAFMPGVSAC